MKQVIAARMTHYYDVVMYEAPPVAVVHDECLYEHGRWLVECGGESAYFNDNREACAYFCKLHVFAQDESNMNKARGIQHDL